MNRCLRWLPVAVVALAVESIAAAPLDFGGSPIVCTDPGNATVPIPCADTAVSRADGYSLIDYSFKILIPPPPLPPLPPLPFPVVAQNDSERAFFNPEMQDLFVWIFGNTKIDVDGADVLFFVQGTLDGEVVTTFSQLVGGHDNHVSWNQATVVDDVAAGMHKLDMHFGVIQIQQGQQSLVNVASLYRVTANDIPEPGSLTLALLALAWLARSGRRGLGSKLGRSG